MDEAGAVLKGSTGLRGTEGREQAAHSLLRPCCALCPREPESRASLGRPGHWEAGGPRQGAAHVP